MASTKTTAKHWKLHEIRHQADLWTLSSLLSIERILFCREFASEEHLQKKSPKIKIIKTSTEFSHHAVKSIMLMIFQTFDAWHKFTASKPRMWKRREQQCSTVDTEKQGTDFGLVINGSRSNVKKLELVLSYDSQPWVPSTPLSLTTTCSHHSTRTCISTLPLTRKSSTHVKRL